MVAAYQAGSYGIAVKSYCLHRDRRRKKTENQREREETKELKEERKKRGTDGENCDREELIQSGLRGCNSI